MGLETITKHIILDISVNKYVSVLVKQYDINVREIIAKITDNGKPYPIDSTIEPRIKCLKEDKKKVFNDCVVLDNGDIKIDVTEQMTICDGIHECELVLFDIQQQSVLHTMNFYIHVRKAPYSDSDIASENEFIALENALLKIDGIKRITESEIDALFS